MAKYDNIDKLLDECRRLIEVGKSTEQILAFLRDCTGMKTASAKIITDLFNISFSEAKAVVHNSKTWADVKERDENFEQTFVEVLEELANE